MTNYNLYNLLTKVGLVVNIDHDRDNNEADLKVYQSIIGKLMYYIYDTWPDILFIGGQLGRHNSNS